MSGGHSGIVPVLPKYFFVRHPIAVYGLHYSLVLRQGQVAPVASCCAPVWLILVKARAGALWLIVSCPDWKIECAVCVILGSQRLTDPV